jgi:pyrroline-5-carboxylate reductase
MSSTIHHLSIAFIGGGNMASAMLGGLHKNGATDIQVVEPSPATRELLQTQFPLLRVIESIQMLLPAQVIVLAVKPQVMNEVCHSLVKAHSWLHSALIVSIAAGTTIGSIAHWLGGHRRIARAMPNTPALIGMGITGMNGSGLSQNDIDNASAIVTSVGKVIWFDTETHLDAVTALSGSGPAYSFYFLEAMQKAGEQMGLSAQDAKMLVVQTMKGAAHLAEQSPDALATLRERVTSKGGTTAAALDVMQQKQLDNTIILALKAAQQRAVELAQSQT